MFWISGISEADWLPSLRQVRVPCFPGWAQAMARCISVVCEENHPFTIWNFENVINVALLIIPFLFLEFIGKKLSLLLFYNKASSKSKWSSHPTLHYNVLIAIAYAQEARIFPFISIHCLNGIRWFLQISFLFHWNCSNSNILPVIYEK